MMSLYLFVYQYLVRVLVMALVGADHRFVMFRDLIDTQLAPRPTSTSIADVTTVMRFGYKINMKT